MTEQQRERQRWETTVRHEAERFLSLTGDIWGPAIRVSAEDVMSHCDTQGVIALMRLLVSMADCVECG